MKHNQTFGCSVFALKNALAAGGKLPKSSPRARLGLNHSQNVNFVSNLSTGLVSPQFHSKFDDFFETIRHSAPDFVNSAQWCFLTGLKRNDGSMMPRNIEVAGPNCEESLGSITLDKTIQFESKVSHEEHDDDQASHQNPAQAFEGDAPPIHNAATSSYGHVPTMSKAIAGSVEQHNFYVSKNMFYMAAHNVTHHNGDQVHDWHL